MTSLSNLFLFEWRLIAVVLIGLFMAFVLLLLRFIQPRALYGSRHILQLIKARRLFLRRLSGRPVQPAAFIHLISQDYRHESLDADLPIVLTRVSRLRELFRLLNPRRTDLPKDVVLPDVSVCVTELAQMISSMADRLSSVPEYDYDLVPAHVVLSAIGRTIQKADGRKWELDNEADIEHWFRLNPISIEQVSEMLIAVIFALSLRERAGAPTSPGKRRTVISLRRRPVDGPDAVLRLIEKGEGKTIEFKATLKRNMHTGAVDQQIEFEVVQTIAAFLNTDGGTILVGIADNGTVCGYDSDLFTTADQVKRYVGSKVQTFLRGTQDQLVATTVETIQDKEVVRIDCQRSPKPAFLWDKRGDPVFFIRSDASTRKLNVVEIKAYIDSRFGM